MKKGSSTNLQKYSGIAEQMVKMSSDCPEITKMILDIIYERDNHVYMREITDFIDKFKKAREQPGFTPRLFY